MKKWLWLCLSAALLFGCRTVASTAPTSPPEDTPQPPSPVPTDTPTPTPSPTPYPTPSSTPDPSVQAERLGRGVNLGNALEAPQEGDWGVVLQEEYFVLIREAGFDTIRVPIRWSAHALDEPPYTIDETFFRRVDWVVDNALAQGLNVVLDMHHYDELCAQPTAHRERFLALWRQIALRYRDRPDSLFLEPLNEPHDRLTPSRWNELLAEVIATIREVDPLHTIIVEGAEWGGVAGLIKLKIPEGEHNAICSFHFYEPMLFTHQGASWVPKEYGTTGVKWPGPPEVKITPVPDALHTAWVNRWFQEYNTLPYDQNPAGPRPIVRAFDQAESWAKSRGCPLWLGEFGAYSKADMESRVRWTTFVRQEAEKRGIGWAYWEFCAGFGIYDPEAKRWREELLRALQ